MGTLTYMMLMFFFWGSNKVTIKLPEAISDNMVVQQNTDVKLWGTSSNHKKDISVNASWTKDTYEVTPEKDGSWMVSIPTGNASFEPQTITFKSGKSEEKISNVLVGEVWFCSGQSNMEMNFKGFRNQPIEGADEVLKTADANSGIRMLRVRRNTPDTPTTQGNGKWDLSTPKNVKYFSATAYFFAMKLKEELNVPIGIINSSYGGSSIESWMKRDLVATYSDIDLSHRVPDSLIWQRPTVMYNGMLKPYVNYTINGFLWYQGEGSMNRAATYEQKLHGLSSLWREEWGLGKLPFYIVEITPYNYSHPTDAAKIRFAQFKASQNIENSGLVCTNDLVLEHEENVAHPQKKQPIGERLANLALSKTYGIDSIQAESPYIDSFVVQNDTVIVRIENTYGEILDQPEFIGFELAGEDNLYYPAVGVLGEDKLSVNVTSLDVLNPVHIRYCFQSLLIGNVKNSVGLPMTCFRSDDFSR